MKKIFLPILSLLLLSIFFIPVLAGAQGLVPCNGPDCTIASFFTLLANIYRFIVFMIATPLAVIAITIGGILMMVSAGNPNLMSTGKKIFYSAVIGLVLVFCSWIIINFILCTVLSYCNWSTL